MQSKAESAKQGCPVLNVACDRVIGKHLLSGSDHPQSSHMSAPQRAGAEVGPKYLGLVPSPDDLTHGAMGGGVGFSLHAQGSTYHSHPFVGLPCDTSLEGSTHGRS